MKRNIYKLLSGLKQRLFVFALTVFFGTGYSQTTYTFNYTGSQQTIALQAGTYTIETWGADGGTNLGNGSTTYIQYGGKGGYSVGTYTLATTTTVYVNVGGVGGNSTSTLNVTVPGGYNGGGYGSLNTTSGKCSGAGGGGASHVATATGTLGALATGTAAVLIVGGGGGGAGESNYADNSTLYNANGGFGGGLSGLQNVSTGYQGRHGKGGTQTVGGTGGDNGSAVAGPPLQGTFGVGGYNPVSGANTSAGGSGIGGGGGGWYGGGAGWGGAATGFCAGSGGGGSGYIGGVINGTTVISGQSGFVTNPDVSGNGLVLIRELCSINLIASGVNSVNPSICSGQSLTLTTNAISNYSWSTGATTSSLVVSPTSNTVYALTATSPSNCTTLKSISITVSSGLPVLSIANPSSNICLGKTVSLTATGAVTYTWVNPGVVNGQTFTPSATTVYTVTGQNGCGLSSSTTTITVAPLAVTTLASPTLVCQGSPSTLTAVSAATGYTWSSNAGFNNTVVVAPMANTIYTVSASDGTCSGTQTVSVATKITPTLNVATTAATICEGQQAVLTATGANTYTWGPGNLSGSSITVTPNQTALYTVIGENGVGCFDTEQQVIIVNSSPTLNITASKITICTGQSVTLNASGGNSYLWTGGPPTASNVVTPLATTVYTVTGSQTSNTCTSAKTITISVVVPNLALPTNTQVCSGKSVTVTASGADVYVWNSISTGSVGMFVLQPTATGNVTLVATTKSLNINCPVTHTFAVTVNALPVLTVTATKSVVCKNQTNTLTVTGAQNYNWTSTITGSTIVITPSANVTYTVLGTDANGCEAIGSHQAKTSSCAGIDEMSVSGEQLVVYPNPNKGTFIIKSESNMDLILVNELGQVIKKFKLEETTNYTYEFKELKPGIYFMQDANRAGVVKQKIVVN